MIRPPRSTRFILVLALFLAALPTLADEPPSRPRVLITNDNGIDDPKIVALAHAFSDVADTWVVAPSTDRSGTGNRVSLTRTGKLDVESRDLGPKIHAFAVDGYPADCVILAIAGLMKDTPPDLVVSGINGGPNLGIDWMFSGTIGAARVAALAGVRAIAVSGLDDDIPGALDAASAWVVRLARSNVVRTLTPPRFLTVSFPAFAPGAKLDVRVTDRAPLTEIPSLEPAGSTTWRIAGVRSLDVPTPDDSDQAAHDDGVIAVVPMRADEVDLELLARWRRKAADFPSFRAPKAESE